VTKLRARYRSQILAALLLAGLCLLFFWRIITPSVEDRGYFPSGDFVDQFYVFRVFEARHLLAGHLPLWNPYTYSGHPFLADIQSAVFYPPGLLTIFLSGPWGFPLYALELEAIGHVFLAGLFTYLFARRLLRADFPALVTAVTFAFGGYLASYPIQQLAILEVQVWLPLILLLLTVTWDRWQERRQSRGAVWAGLALGVSLLAGHPQSSMYVLYIAAAYWGFLTYEGRKRLGAKAALFGLFLLTGLGVAAVQLVPGLEFMLLSTRAGGTYQEMAHGFPLHDILQVALPGILSQWSPLYVGILPLLLASLGVYLVRRRMVVFWVAVALAALLLSLGGGTFLYSVFYLLVPGFGIFRSQERAAFAFSFAMAVLAGYGAQVVVGPWAQRTRELIEAGLWGVVAAVGASMGLMLAFLWGWLRAGLAVDSPFGPMLNRAVLLVVFLLLGAACLYARRRELTSAVGLMAVVLVVIIFDLFTVNWQNNFQAANPLQDYGPKALLTPIQADDAAGRVYNEWRLPGNYGMYYEIEDTGGASPLRIAWYDELLEGVPVERLWELTGVEYAITWRGTLAVASQRVYEESAGQDSTYLHRLAEQYPRAYVVHQAEVLGEPETLERLTDAAFDPLETVVLTEKPALAMGGGSSAAGSTARVVSYGPSRIVVDVDAVGDGILVMSEVFYPGWRAHVDGNPTQIHRANHAFRAVEVEAGSHRVELAYEPLSLKLGSVVSLASLVLIVAVAIRGRVVRS
jgi:hypothetical protein